jgi:hypothetical protein
MTISLVCLDQKPNKSLVLSDPYFDKETAYKYYNEFMWGTRYAKIITVEKAIQLLKSEITIEDV